MGRLNEFAGAVKTKLPLPDLAKRQPWIGPERSVRGPYVPPTRRWQFLFVTPPPIHVDVPSFTTGPKTTMHE